METEKKISGNMWGWRWSWISLGIILLGFVLLIFVDPIEIEDTNLNETEKVDSLIENTPK